MKKEFSLALLGCSGLLFLTAGCTTELAQIPVGEEEKAWDKILKMNYYAFTPPHASAPASYQPAVPASSQPAASKPVTDDPESAVDRAASGDMVVVPVTDEKPVQKKVAQLTQAEPVPAAEFSKAYVVRSGDTLGKIARRVYGKSSMSDVIFRANRDVLTDSNKLRPGMKLQIPEL